MKIKEKNLCLKKSKIYNLLFCIIVFLLCCIMIYFVNKKNGFHADEMFSYGSSNYKYDNVFQPYGDRDYINKFINENIKSINDIIFYIANPQKFTEKLNEIEAQEEPVWKTNEDAIEYMTVQSDEIFDFFSIFYNQSRDAHPPLFYYFVHIISCFYLNRFSKYILFIINISSFIGLNILIKKIFELLDKKYLVLPTVITYGLSIGCVSTIMFQRMYMLLTFFIVYYTYICIKILKNNCIIDRKIKHQLSIITILGFLTHYYFCLYAFVIMIGVGIQLYKTRGRNELIKLYLYNIKLAFIGILIFPACIYHIFFSYRGVTSISNEYSVIDYFRLLANAFSLNFAILCIILIIFFIISIIKVKKKHDTIELTLLISFLVFIIISSKISPYLEMRYIMGILPIFAILLWESWDYLIKNSSKYIFVFISVLIISFLGISLKENGPLYLYSDYMQNIKIANENYNIKFIYIEDNSYNHIQSMPEFMIYENSLIINTSRDELKYLENNKGLVNESSFIVSIKKYMNVNEIIEKIINLTKFENYNILLDGDENILYKFYL